MAKLVVISKGIAATAYELGESWVTIGRGDGNAFQLPGNSVSGRHCEVRLRGEELLVRDLLSTNGTFVGKQKISEAVLKSGQILRVGDVELRFEFSPSDAPGTSFTTKMLVTKTADTTAAQKNPPPVTPAPIAPEKSANEKPADAVVKKFQVLFVDDSMAFLEVFSSLCEEFSQHTWKIHTAASPDQALLILQKEPVDLAVLDIGMPLLDGLQLLGIIARRHPGVKIAVLTGGATEARRADALANGAELFIEKPVTPDGMKMIFNMLNELLSWTHREGFSGALRHVTLPDVIQMECVGRRSSILEIRNVELRGQIFIESGAITHASAGALSGEPAFYKLLALHGGEFQLKPYKAPPQRTIENRWEFLLMDAARAADEETDLRKRTDMPAPENKTSPPKNENAHGEGIVVVATYDGKWNAADGEKK
jgi:CheY-like chemotaxis protein